MLEFGVLKALSVTSLEHVQALNLWWGVSKMSCSWTMWSCTNKGSCSSLKYWNGKGVPPSGLHRQSLVLQNGGCGAFAF